MSDREKNWLAIASLASQIKKCDELGLVTPSIAMSYICIDAMASLSRPLNKSRVTRLDFIEWVDSYVKCDPEQVYKYRGIDFYAARCTFLHTYGSKSELHEKDSDIMQFVYCDGGRHFYNPSKDPNLVIIGTKSFTKDIINAVTDFLDECGKDLQLKFRVEGRLSEVLDLVPISEL